MTINDAQIKQNEFNLKHNHWKIYKARKEDYVKANNNSANNANNFYNKRETTIKVFEEGIFLLRSEEQQTSKKTNKNWCVCI